MNIGFIICLLIMLKVLLLVGFSSLSSNAFPEERAVYHAYFIQANQLVDVAILIAGVAFLGRLVATVINFF